MAKGTRLEENTKTLSIRVFVEDYAAFERLRAALADIPADQLGRLLWRLAISKAPELVADVMRLALLEHDEPAQEVVLD